MPLGFFQARRELVGNRASMEKFCPVCGRSYPNTGPDICEDDGERLVAVAPHPDLVGTTLEGKYEIRGQLGEGGMGTV